MVQRSEIGWYDDGSADGLSGLDIRMMLACFQMLGPWVVAELGECVHNCLV